MSNNSYQKNGGVGVYNEVPNGGSASDGGSKKKLFAAVAVVAVAIAGYFYVDSNKNSGAAVSKVMAKADLNVKANGKLKLFDNQSKLVFGRLLYFCGPCFVCFLELMRLITGCNWRSRF